ncbi:MAG: hypothetical protein RLZZ267_838 [Bacillota bacterium]|jgi:uncharacterized protein YbjT (DUF2867 family)
MNAIVVGATGAVGKDLVELLVKDDSFKQVDVFVRRKLDVQHDKLNIHIIDFDKPEQWGHLVKADVLFSCLGTTLKTAGSKEAQWKIDYDYQYAFAKQAKVNDVSHYVLVSATGSSPNAKFFYPRMKGMLEEAVKALEFRKLTIFRPPLLIRKNTDRPGEVIGYKVLAFLNRLGIARSQKPLATEALAQAMINAVKTK